MPVIAVSHGSPGPRFGRRSIAAIGGIAVAALLSLAILSNQKLGRAVGEGVSDSIAGVKTVAAMLAERSPGERPDGALANLKPKRQAVLHERVLPKVRGPTPYEALVGTPPSPPIAPPVETPLYNVVAGAPPIVIPPTTGVVPGMPGGPPIFSNIPTPGGGGGGIFSPPVVAATPETPPIPVTPVPEPATWTTMLVGFALIGRVLRRKRAVQTTTG